MHSYKLQIKNFIVHDGKVPLKRNRLINNTKLALFILAICKNIKLGSKLMYEI